MRRMPAGTIKDRRKFYEENKNDWWSLISNKEIGETWIPDIFLSPFAPNYLPKKFDRTLESINNTMWREIVFELKNNEENKK